MVMDDIFAGITPIHKNGGVIREELFPLGKPRRKRCILGRQAFLYCFFRLADID